MAKVKTPEIVVPEMAGETLAEREAFVFIRDLFVSNGCLGDYADPIISASFFAYSRRSSDHEPKQAAGVSYLVRRGKPVVIFDWRAERIGLRELDERQERQSILSDGYNTMASAGNERYRIATVAAGRSLQAPVTAIEASYDHRSGRATGTGWFGSTTRLSGYLLEVAAEEVSPGVNITTHEKPYINARAVANLLELLVERAS